MFLNKNLTEIDPELSLLLRAETARQGDTISLAAASSRVPASILEAWSSSIINIDLEGYPPERLSQIGVREMLDLPSQELAYYREAKTKFSGGTVFAEIIEELARRRAVQVFGKGKIPLWANVQAATGAMASIVALRSVANNGDTVLMLETRSGGHPCQGGREHLTGQMFRTVSYGLAADETTLDYDDLQSLVAQYSPKALIAGFTSFPREIDWQRLKLIVSSGRKKCFLIADLSHVAGLVAADQFSNPAGYADLIFFSTYKTLLGPRGAVLLSSTRDLGRRVDAALFPGIQFAPVSTQIPAIAAVLQLAQTDGYRDLQAAIIRNAKLLAEQLRGQGLPIAFGGTDSHMIILDGRSMPGMSSRMDGNAVGRWLETAGIVCNRVFLPGDSPAQMSGIRMGVTEVTQMGITAGQIKELAAIIASVMQLFIQNQGNFEVSRKRLEQARQQALLLQRQLALF